MISVHSTAKALTDIHKGVSGASSLTQKLFSLLNLGFDSKHYKQLSQSQKQIFDALYRSKHPKTLRAKKASKVLKDLLALIGIVGTLVGSVAALGGLTQSLLTPALLALSTQFSFFLAIICAAILTLALLDFTIVLFQKSVESVRIKSLEKSMTLSFNESPLSDTPRQANLYELVSLLDYGNSLDLANTQYEHRNLRARLSTRSNMHLCLRAHDKIVKNLMQLSQYGKDNIPNLFNPTHNSPTTQNTLSRQLTGITDDPDITAEETLNLWLSYTNLCIASFETSQRILHNYAISEQLPTLEFSSESIETLEKFNRNATLFHPAALYNVLGVFKHLELQLSKNTEHPAHSNSHPLTTSTHSPGKNPSHNLKPKEPQEHHSEKPASDPKSNLKHSPIFQELKRLLTRITHSMSSNKPKA